MVGGYIMPIPFEIDVSWQFEDVTELFGGKDEFLKRVETLMSIQKPFLLNMVGNGLRYAQWAVLSGGDTEYIFKLNNGIDVSFDFSTDKVICTYD